ncbi:MAG: SDR family oxidoreductase [Pseudomonadota bacterium]|nr:SDR family oxidoreductase [Pseudomonadota bacterium]
MISLPKTPSFSLKGKRALVAGASAGIGFGCSAALADAGAEVVLASRPGERLDASVDAIRSEGGRAEALPLDISDIKAVENAVGRSGPFDILVNSAGQARHGPAIETSPEDFDAVVGINFRGAYFLTRAVAAGLIEAGKPGSLVNISSQMGHVGGQDRAVYCATKHAVEGFTKAMAIEWGRNQIRVNTICPTFIRTLLAEATFSDPKRKAWIMDNIRLDRVGEIEDIMGAVVYLASDAAAMVTGTSLIIDGGWTAA